ncbi:hypothetical protein 1 [Hubei toti-like virus 13]|uniref:Capsid protein n=1 Tax=Hubei toti-like virus 13 TaxID=1923301 RepID=A0A1L3KF29_9VIRU|nr:hypothetical protein 1 [Hubei toti-like virus 13]APG76018.1 hypothetical protein 1 [Hubei toti-like virus 13]
MSSSQQSDSKKDEGKTPSTPNQHSNNAPSSSTLLKQQQFFDPAHVLQSTTAQVLKTWFLHPYTGVGPHSVSFSQSLTNRDIINMYSQSGNYFYHSNCYSASYWTASSSYHQYAYKKKSSLTPSGGSSTPPAAVQSSVHSEDSYSFISDSGAGLLDIGPNVGIYYQNFDQIPSKVVESLSPSVIKILKESDKHKLTLGRKLVLPSTWRKYQPFEATRWGKNSKDKINQAGSSETEIDLNTVTCWPRIDIKYPNKDSVKFADKKWTPLADKSAYYTQAPIPSDKFPEALGIEGIDDATFQGNLDCGDTVPVRSITRTFSMLPSDIDANRSIPTTNVYSQFLVKLTKDLPDDAFRSMISRPAITDADSRIWLAYNLSQLKYGSYMDVIPPTVAMLLLHSLTADRHWVDPIIFRTIRNKSIRAYDKDIAISARPATEYPNLIVVSSHLTHFVKYMSRTVPVHDSFDPNMIDDDWIAVPVTTELLAVPTKLGAFVMCHLSSEFWNGTITWSKKHAYSIPDSMIPDGQAEGYKQKFRMGKEYFMPSSNSVYIDGVKKVWLVIMPSTSNATATIKLYNTTVPRSPDKDGKLSPKDLTPFWATYWQGTDRDNIPLLITDFFWALCAMTNSTVTPDSTRRAMGLATELCNVSYPGNRFQNSTEVQPALIGGAWTYGGQKVFKNKYDSSDWVDAHIPVKNASYPRRTRMAGFSFSATSPFLQHPSSLSTLTQNLYLYNLGMTTGEDQVVKQIWVIDKIRQRWATTQPTYNVPQYIANQATSFCRLSVAAGFLETGGGREYRFSVSPAVQQFLTHNGAAMFGNTTNFLIANDIQPWFWMGYGYGDHPHFLDAYATLFKQLTQSMMLPVNIYNLAISCQNLDWNNIVEYYNTDPFDQERWMQSAPIPVSNYLQWNQKMDLPQTPNTGEVQPVQLFGKQLYGLKLDRTNSDLKARIFLLVNDRKTEWPKATVFDANDETPYNEWMWLDDYYFMSTALVDAGQMVTTKWDGNAYLSSNTYARSTSPGVLGYEAETLIVVTSGLGLGRNAVQSLPHVTPVSLPDPPDAKTFLAAKVADSNPPPPPEMKSDPIPTKEQVSAVTDAVTPVTDTITQA